MILLVAGQFAYIVSLGNSLHGAGLLSGQLALPHAVAQEEDGFL